MKRTIFLVLAVAALVAPSALAQSPVQRIIAQERARSHDASVVGSVPQPTTDPVQRIIAQENAHSRDPGFFGVPASTPIQIVEPGGFDWGDAGIGASAAVALMLLALGGTLLLKHGRVRSA